MRNLTKKETDLQIKNRSIFFKFGFKRELFVYLNLLLAIHRDLHFVLYKYGEDADTAVRSKFYRMINMQGFE